MTKEEIRLQVAISCIQGILEAKHGIIAEVAPEIAVVESLRIADKFVEQWDKKEEEDKSEMENLIRRLEHIARVAEDSGTDEIKAEVREAIEYITKFIKK